MAVTRGLVVFHDYDQPTVRAAVDKLRFVPVAVVDTLAVCETTL
jgi:hypothetical protein